jgi:hypothetical protein
VNAELADKYGLRVSGSAKHIAENIAVAKPTRTHLIRHGRDA